MALPKKINILGFTYKIELVDSCTEIIVGGRACFGSCDFIEQTIRIAKDQDYQQMVQTLLHEIIHAIDYIMSGNEGTQLEEKQTDLIATGLASVIFGTNWRNLVKTKNI